MSAKLKIALLLAAVGGVAILLVSSLRDSEDSQAKQTDGSFVVGMISHHQMAIDMARIAQSRSQHPEIAQLANDIVATQMGEIGQMRAVHERLFGNPVPSGASQEHGSLGLSPEAAGMAMDSAAIKDAQPFDRAFIDMMIAHHQGAIRMARIELAQGQDAELQGLAHNIIAAQSREIVEMNKWRKRWYGSRSPAGGVPNSAESSAPSHKAMGRSM